MDLRQTRSIRFDNLDDIIDFGDIWMDSRWLPGWKAFEFFGEACPQLILSVVFMANNYDFMRDNNTFIDVKVRGTQKPIKFFLTKAAD